MSNNKQAIYNIKMGSVINTKGDFFVWQHYVESENMDVFYVTLVSNLDPATLFRNRFFLDYYFPWVKGVSVLEMYNFNKSWGYEKTVNME